MSTVAGIRGHQANMEAEDFDVNRNGQLNFNILIFVLVNIINSILLIIFMLPKIG